MAELRAISEDNFSDAFHLRLAPGQEKYVSHPIRSLAQAYVYREQCQPFGIYADGKMIGYVMVIYDYDVPEYDIWHMMIDESSQGHGFGGEALDRVIEFIRTKPFGDSGRIALTCNKSNTLARKLYEGKETITDEFKREFPRVKNLTSTSRMVLQDDDSITGDHELVPLKNAKFTLKTGKFVPTILEGHTWGSNAYDCKILC